MYLATSLTENANNSVLIERNNVINSSTRKQNTSLQCSSEQILLLQDLVIKQYMRIYPDLDVNAIIEHRACWPIEFTIDFKVVARKIGEGRDRETLTSGIIPVYRWRST